MGKSAYHRDKNTFRFKSFGELVSEVNIDAVRKLSRTRLNPDGADTFFGESMCKWSDLNCTDNFVSFSKKVHGKYQSLPIVVHHQDAITEALIFHLLDGSPLSLEPLLDLTVQLSRDLQGDFYKNFDRIFGAIVKILDSHMNNAEILKHVFVAVAYLFKYLWRYVIKDIRVMYKKYVRLLSKDYPSYINTFAAESFSYLLRRSLQPKDIRYILLSATEDGMLNEGIARLFFETVRGVQAGFHSAVDVILPELLNTVQNCETGCSQAIDIICHLISSMGQHSSKENFTVIWTACKECILSPSKLLSANRDLATQINILKSVQGENTGRMVVDEDDFIQTTMQLLRSITCSGAYDLLSIVVNQLRRQDSTLTAESVTREILFSALPHSCKVEFMRMVCEVNMANRHVLPVILEYCFECHRVGNDVDESFVLVVAQILINNSTGKLEIVVPKISNFKANEHQKYSFPWLLGQILCGSKFGLPSKWASLFCLSQMNHLERDQIFDFVHIFFMNLVELEPCESQVTIWLQCFHAALLCFQRFLREDELLFKITIDMIGNVIEKFPSHIYSLEITRSYFEFFVGSASKDNLFERSKFDKLFNLVERCLISPFARVRWNTLQILKSMSTIQNDMTTDDTLSAVEDCIAVEECSVDLSTFREKMRLLSKLKCPANLNESTSRRAKSIILRFLMGNLFINFAPLWKPLCQLIATFGNELESNEFWNIYGHELKEETKFSSNLDKESSTITCDILSPEAVINNYKKLCSSDYRPDYWNYRNLLWNAMKLFPSECERKSRVIAPIFYDFVTEVYLVNAEHDKDNLMKYAPKRSQQKKTLIACLEIFGMFSNPKNIHLSAKLELLYLDLLQEKDEDIAKAALKCLGRYRHGYLEPYVSNLERLIDNKSFKNEIILFDISEEGAVVKKDHRADLLPIMMRILSAKVLAKGTRDTSSKIRKDLVFKYLASARNDELSVFLDLILNPLVKEGFLSSPIRTICCKTFNEKISTKQQFGILGTLELLMKRIPFKMEGHLYKMFHVLITLAKVVSEIMVNRQDKAPHVVKNAKKIHHVVLARIGQFFSTYESFSAREEDIEVLFEVIIWPELTRISYEGVYNPTPLMKLLFVWSKNEKFLDFLSCSNPVDGNKCMLEYLFELLVSPKASKTVTTFIMDMISNLLMDYEEITEGNPTTAESRDEKNQDIPKGVSLLLPHASSILNYIQLYISNQSSLSKPNLEVELKVLSCLNHYAPVKEICENICNILLSIARKNARKETPLLNIVLHSLKCAIRGVHRATDMVPFVSELFSLVTKRTSRRYLCEIYQSLSDVEPDLAIEAQLAIKMNSWDRRYVEEPDYLVRLDAFNECLHKVIETKNERLLLLLIHNSLYTLTNTEDMSLRDAGRQSIEKIMSLTDVCEDEESFFKNYISKYLLTSVKRNVGCSNENVRNEFLNILRSMVQCYPKQQELADLKLLMDQDIELDFFSNITHIQVHRRSRALKKASKLMIAQQIHLKSVWNFILPIAHAFTEEEVYLKHPDIADAAVGTIGAAAKCLPWSKYHHLLKECLRKSDQLLRHKLTIRIIVAILDNFHFDMHSPMGSPEDKVNTYAVHTQNVKIKASRIQQILMDEVIPDLYECLTRKSKSEDQHKKAKAGKFAEDEEILNVPIALAIVKLLRLMPKEYLHQNLSRVLLKVCHFLRSRSQDIRTTARQTLIKITDTLTVAYLPYILKELCFALTKGYQRHVLSFTVYAILHELSFSNGELDASMDTIIEICVEELFGDVAAEKEVDGIRSNLFEAKSTKSIFTLGILAKYATNSTMSKLVLRVKERIMGSASSKKHQRAIEVLRQICSGLMRNDSLEVQTLLEFIFDILSDSSSGQIVQLKPSSWNVRPKSTYLLETDGVPKRTKKVENPKETSSFIFTEFGAQLLYLLMHRSKLQSSNMNHLQLLDPLVEILTQTLSSRSVKVVSTVIKCLTKMFKFPLPALRDQIDRISQELYLFLNSYARGGAAKGDNHNLVLVCFRAMTVLVREVHYYQISEEQLNVLLAYCELDTVDFDRQATAFSLLRAILSRKLSSPALPKLMAHLRSQSITAEASSVRLSCRQVVMQYLLDYPIGCELNGHLEFYVSQLDYEFEHGRKSALEMIASMLKYFPKKTIYENSGLFFLPLCGLLSNEESPTCRVLCSIAIKDLLNKLPDEERDNLLRMCFIWFQDSKYTLKKTALFLVSQFTEVEGASFARHVTETFELFKSQMKSLLNFASEPTMADRHRDILLYHVLHVLLKIHQECGHVMKELDQVSINELWHLAESCLEYPHVWVQLGASQLFGFVFQINSPSELIQQVKVPNSCCYPNIFADDFGGMLQSLCWKFTKQLFTDGVTEILADQLVRNLVYIGKVLLLLKVDPDISLKRSFDWLLRRMCREAKSEKAISPKHFIKRLSVVKWFAAVTVELSPAELTSYLPLILSVIARENINEDSEKNSLNTVCQESMALWKDIVGVDTFTRIFIQNQQRIFAQRRLRKAQKLQKAALNPSIQAKKTLKKNLAKKESNKRKSSLVRYGRIAKQPRK